METNNQKILETVQNYIDGYLGAQSGLMKKAFHTQTRLFSVDEEDLDTTEMIDWLSNIEERQLKGDIRKGKSEINKTSRQAYKKFIKNRRMLFEWPFKRQIAK